MDKIYNELAGDKHYTQILKREANILLASLDNKSDKYIEYKRCFDAIILLFENTKTNDIKLFTKIINNIAENKLLSPLTLEDYEFDCLNKQGYICNSRYPWIYKSPDGNIYNNNAYKCTVRAEYEHVLQSQLCSEKYEVEENPRIYISKGGIITGECVKDCIIRQECINKHLFSIQSVVNIPVSKIYYSGKYILIVDHREPKLKALMSFYDVPVHKDEKIASLKFNLRKYRKL